MAHSEPPQGPPVRMTAIQGRSVRVVCAEHGGVLAQYPTVCNPFCHLWPLLLVSLRLANIIL